ncbi:MAG TPA: membrane protein insertase YidC [Streptosporangiaceae bacterium]|nr:membrane protein insertase YidC [Streptosporangiaceae bacterium]
MLGFLNAPLGVAYHFLFMLAQLLAPLPGGLATAAAIIVFTVAVRLLLAPLSFAALRGQAGLAALQPRVAELRARYAHQPDRLERELAAFYQAQGGTLLAGCLPLLLQLPFFSVMYRLFLSRTVAGKPNALLARDLLGAPLGGRWLTGAGPLSAHGLVFLGVLALLALACFAIARIGRASSRAEASQVDASQTDPMRTASGTAGTASLLTRVLPYLTVAIAAFVPLAAGLYLLTTTAWTAAERVFWRRWSRRPGQLRPTASAG